jgi:probable rRNA maturation factor
VKIYISNKQKDLNISTTSAKQAVELLLDYLHIRCDEISFHFVTTKKICQLHADFFDDPTTTDCITFPIDETSTDDYRVLGEVFICPKTAIDYCNSKKGEPHQETTLYLIHGLLHLIGYDDIEPLDRKKMRRKERDCIRFLEKRSAFLKEKKIV